MLGPTSRLGLFPQELFRTVGPLYGLRHAGIHDSVGLEAILPMT